MQQTVDVRPPDCGTYILTGGDKEEDPCRSPGQRCRARVTSSVWWPGVSQQIVWTVQGCDECAKNATHQKEPLITSQLPHYPWQVVGTGLLELDGAHYLFRVVYFS